MDLPDEMLINIFARTKYLLKLTRVCRRFCDVIGKSMLLMKRIRLYWVEEKGICSTNFLMWRNYSNIKIELLHKFDPAILDFLEAHQSTIVKLKVTFKPQPMRNPIFYIPRAFQNILQIRKSNRLSNAKENGSIIEKNLTTRAIRLSQLKELEVYNEVDHQFCKHLQFQADLLEVFVEKKWVEPQNFFGPFDLTFLTRSRF